MLRSVTSAPEPEPPARQEEISNSHQLTLVKWSTLNDLWEIMKHRKNIPLFAQTGSIRDFANFAYVMKGEDVQQLFDQLSPPQIKGVLAELKNIITRQTEETLVNPTFINDHITHKYTKLVEGIFGKLL